jgi:hypothetical protein
MSPYTRDPVALWFDRVAIDFLRRGYAHPHRETVLYVPPPSRARREEARTMYDIPDLDARDRWGETRWIRALKRSVYWNHKEFGYAEEFRPGDPRVSDAAGTSLKWKTGTLIRKAGWPTRRRLVSIWVVDGGDAAIAAVRHDRRPAKRYTVNATYRSMPGPPDRPWEPGF